MRDEALTAVVVDDDVAICDLVEEILRGTRFTVYPAYQAVSALDVLWAHPDAQLLVTDIKMPMIDGFMLADMVKMRHPQLHVLYMTGGPSRFQPEPGVLYGPTILKPFRPEQLVAAVEESCRKPVPWQSERY